MNYTDDVKRLIESVIKANNNQEITGPILQRVLDAMLNKSEELYLLVDSIQQGGIAVLQELGESETMSISQKVITEFLTTLQQQIAEAGKVDGVLVNGQNVVVNKIAYISIPDAISIEGETLII